MVARFLNYFPQYTLQDLCTGDLSPAHFYWLFAGMMDVEMPELTRPLADVHREQIKDIAARHHEQMAPKGKGW